MVQNQNNNAVVVGIVSWGTLECETKKPDVYTNVAKYSKWITDNTDCIEIDDVIACPNFKGGFQNMGKHS